jgi:hypothetical protein
MTVVRDLKVKLRMNVMFIEQQERGSEKPGSDSKGGHRHIVADMPEIICDYEELQRRMSDAALVLHEGWELDNDGPPAVRTAGVTDCTNASHNADESPVAVNLNDVEITHALAGLTPGTKYYYRPWVNTAGLYTRYGAVRSFTTPLV